MWSEYRVRWQDGSIHWLQGSNTVVYQNQHEQIIQRMFVDVTESRELQEQLSREREMYRLAMESSNDVMYEYTFATDTLVVYEPRIRENGDSYVDKTEFDFYRQRVENNQIVHPQDTQKVLENICMGKGQAFDCRFFTPQVPKGEGVWYHVTGKVIYQKGVPYRVVGTLRNIHAQKRPLATTCSVCR